MVQDPILQMDQGPSCKCNWLVENQLIPIRYLWEKSSPKIQVKGGVHKLWTAVEFFWEIQGCI